MLFLWGTCHIFDIDVRHDMTQYENYVIVAFNLPKINKH